MKASKLSFIVIILLAAIVGYGSWAYLAEAKTTIYLFNDNYPAGAKIYEEMITPIQADSTMVNNLLVQGTGAYITEANKSEVLGDTLKVDVAKGSPFMAGQTDKFSASPAETRLTPDNIAITIPTDNVLGVTPWLVVGSRINVYTFYQGEDDSVIENLDLQNIKVIDIQYAEKLNESMGTPVISALTFDLTPEQAMKLNYAAQVGAVRLGLVKNGQYKEVSQPPFFVVGAKASTETDEDGVVTEVPETAEVDN